MFNVYDFAKAQSIYPAYYKKRFYAGKVNPIWGNALVSNSTEAEQKEMRKVRESREKAIQDNPNMRYMASFYTGLFEYRVRNNNDLWLLLNSISAATLIPYNDLVFAFYNNAPGEYKHRFVGNAGQTFTIKLLIRF